METQNTPRKRGWVSKSGFGPLIPYEVIKGQLDKTATILKSGRRSYYIEYSAESVDELIIGRG